MRRVIIVGATSGIGRALARIYAGQNDQVGITGRRKELLDSLFSEFPRNMQVACFDATAADSARQLEMLVDKLGGLDLLVYNAGFGEPAEMPDPAIDQETVSVNILGFLQAIHFGFRYFLRQGHGHLVTISSIASKRGNQYALAYSASKAFQSIYFEGLYMKVKLAKLPIYVTDVQPGFVDTKMAKSHKLFWVAPVDKAARQIASAIDKKKWRAYITRRWTLIAWIMKWVPESLYLRMR